MENPNIIVRSRDSELETIDRKSGELHAPMKRNAEFYNMNHKKRGLALIFSQERFDKPLLEERRGTKQDCENLRKCLTNLGFKVLTFCDSDYLKIVEEFSKAGKQDHSEHDCIVISIMSHGHQDILYAKDIAYNVEYLMFYLSPDLCPTLAGKPKIFFIQACQGDQYDLGCTLSSSQTDGERLVSCNIPLRADFLVMYSTAKGFKAWRDPKKGSWFIQALVQELEARASEFNILDILTYVNQIVAIEFETVGSGNPDMNGMKQISCIVSMLTRFMKFTRKF